MRRNERLISPPIFSSFRRGADQRVLRRVLQKDVGGAAPCS